MDLVYNTPIVIVNDSFRLFAVPKQVKSPSRMGGAKDVKLDLGDLDLDLVAQSVGLDDTVNDGLVVQDLAGGNGSAFGRSAPRTGRSIPGAAALRR